VKKTFGEKVVAFNKKLKFSGNLPEGFEVMNPFFDNPETITVMSKFYQKFYNDYHQRKFIIGINPSRRGAGVTGVPFTDTKRLETMCGIEMKTAHTHEISSVFLYDVIENFGGVEVFYKKFYINSPFPLAIIRKTLKGNLNANYYDDKDLFEAVKPFMIQSLKDHIDLGLDTSEVFILGKKNATFIDKINSQEKFFEKMTVLEHPRYIQQYKIKEKQLYIDKYLIALNKAI
jgi:hypothetical protein